MTAAREIPDFADDRSVEGLARVVAIDRDVVWLEPEQKPSCAGCASVAACGAKGIGTLASRLEQRRFSLPQGSGAARLQVGDRVVVGIGADSLMKGSLVAYAIPMLSALVAGSLAQAVDGRDSATLLACLAGLALGIGIAHLFARRLSGRGELAPRFLRRADGGPACHSSETSS